MGYIDKALDVFNEIRKVYKKAEIEILKGYKGQFDIMYEDNSSPKLLYSKKTKGGLPQDGDILYYIRKMKETKS